MHRYRTTSEYRPHQERKPYTFGPGHSLLYGSFSDRKMHESRMVLAPEELLNRTEDITFKGTEDIFVSISCNVEYKIEKKDVEKILIL